MCNYNVKPNPNILILGGWYGSFLIPMLLERLNPSSIIHTDIDKEMLSIASQLHKNKSQCSFTTLNVDSPQQQFDVDVVINTSCEHMNSFGEKVSLNAKCLYVLQSCDNNNDPGHINTVASTADFLFKVNFSKVLFSGRQNLGHKNRFMVIGVK